MCSLAGISWEKYATAMYTSGSRHIHSFVGRIPEKISFHLATTFDHVCMTRIDFLVLETTIAAGVALCVNDRFGKLLPFRKATLKSSR